MSAPKDAYLTIDDSPSGHTDALTDFLAARGVPAVLFCRGDFMEQNPGPVVRAIRKGFVVANHAYAHQRASQISFEDLAGQIRQTENLIDDAYRAAAVARPVKWFRFPYLDRGYGGSVIDYDAVPAYKDMLTHFFTEGLGTGPAPITAAAHEKKEKIQEFLKTEGFLKPAFAGVTHPWYRETEMATAVDAMFTFSTSDWMLTARHKGKWVYKTLDDLKAKIDNDPDLTKTDSRHVILVHDQDDIHVEVTALIDHFLAHGFRFMPVV